MNNPTITGRRKDSVIILDLKGQIKIGEGNVRLYDAIVELVSKGEKNIPLNLEGVSSID